MAVCAKKAVMSSYPVVLKDEFCKISVLLCPLIFATFDSARSSYAYQGWQGPAYHQAYAKSRFSQDTLAEYADYEMDSITLFRTVGIDHSFCRAASAAQLAHYAKQVPEDFCFCSKVREEIPSLLSFSVGA
jgi:hypothetical protein